MFSLHNNPSSFNTSQCQTSPSRRHERCQTHRVVRIQSVTPNAVVPSSIPTLRSQASVLGTFVGDGRCDSSADSGHERDAEHAAGEWASEWQQSGTEGPDTGSSEF